MLSAVYNTNMEDGSIIRNALRKAIEANPKSRYTIARETKIPEPTLCLFMQGKRGMLLERLEYLADYLGLEITIRPKKGAKKNG